MEDSRGLYLRLCKEGGVEPQEGVLDQLQEGSRLDLSGQSLSADTCSVLARALQDGAFTQVSLSDCMLSEEGAKTLLSGLFGNTTVKSLDMKGNNLRSAGAEVLGKLLARNKTLCRLVLEWNALGVWEEAFSAFCDGLGSNNTLTHLDLRNNQISHHGAAALALALRRSGSLEELDLRWNNLGLLGGRSLLEALQSNKSMVKLKVAGNNIPSDTLKALEQTAGHNSDRQTTLRENHSRTQVLSREIQTLKEDKGRQFLSLMETIDRQKEEMGRSNRSASVQISHLQEALNERKSAVKTPPVHDSLLREGKLLREIQNLTETNGQLRSKVRELEQRCKSQQQQIFELKQELANSTAELKMRLAQADDRLEMEKRRSKQALEDSESLRQKEVEHVSRRLEESERLLQERVLKLEEQRIQLEEVSVCIQPTTDRVF
uniref:Leucine rich repeat containing 45 n=1 Tax=Oryzias sinensis TaxID=183150 RepID=A0A8C7Y3A4_9TELE